MKIRELIFENFPLPVDGKDIFLAKGEKIGRVVVGADLGKPTYAYISSLIPPIKKGNNILLRTFTLPDSNNPGQRFYSVIPVYHLEPYPGDEALWDQMLK